MTELAEVGPTDIVLEVGTGCGYQTAILAQLVDTVYTLELVPELAEQAKTRLDRLGYNNVHVRVADGYQGWEEHAPFDAIIVTAAADEVPPALVAQLAPKARLVIPCGGRFLGQELLLVCKNDAGRVEQRSVLPVSFVPLRHPR
jgi:protein-L-isoaspartate(D-aspartate) O-methyltransferase